MAKRTSERRDAAEPGKPLERLEGTVERITFKAEDTGFCIIKVRAKGRRGLVAVKGHLAAIAEGEDVAIQGHWGFDPRYGEEFRAERIEPMVPVNPAGITRFLGSGLIKGIGPELAKRIVARFGAETIEVLDDTPGRLRDVPGIGSKRVGIIRSAWQEHRAVRRILVAMQGFGIGLSHAKRIYDTYGDRSIDVVQKEPYRMAREIRGIGFKTADRIALSTGTPRDAPQRVRAGCTHVLWEMTSDGHVCAPREELAQKASEALDVPLELVAASLDEAISARDILLERFDDADHVYVPALHAAEIGSARRLVELLHPARRKLPAIDVPRAIEWAERRGQALSDGQRRAVETALRSPVAVITGGPGVGKTTVVRTLIEIVLAKGARVGLAAPTGRAAKRLGEATRQGDAKTIHRLLEWSPQEAKFTRHEQAPLPFDVLVVDEVSMVDVSLFHSLLRAVEPGTTLVLVGDRDQLPSVGPGTVLADVIASKTVPVAELTEVFRQGARSRIVTSAHTINAGEIPDLENPPPEVLGDFYFIEKNDPPAALEALKKLVKERIPARFGLDPVRDVQVIAPMHRGEVGAQNLNRELQALLNPNPVAVNRFGRGFAKGDKVMQTVNDYEREVYNGDIGRVDHVDAEGGKIDVDFDGRLTEYSVEELDALQLAYAISVHKSQGSEYPAVVIPLLTQHYVMLRRNLVYTAITRARSLCCVVGSRRAIEIAVRASGEARRHGFLERRLKDEASARP